MKEITPSKIRHQVIILAHETGTPVFFYLSLSLVALGLWVEALAQLQQEMPSGGGT